MEPIESEAFKVFDRLYDLPPEERLEALAREPLDEATRAQVRRLLDLAEPPESWLGGERRALEAPEVPESIGSYEVERVLGSGGMGVVYLARQQNPQRRVAVKLMRDAIEGQEARRRFELEAELLGRLQHPGIAQVIESGTFATPASRAYIAMEYVEGENLAKYTDSHDLDRDERLRLLARIAEAVHHAHQRGVIHRDLKPSNILVTSDGLPKLIDFGVARAADPKEALTAQTMMGQLLGTLAYMSPEQVRGDIFAIDARVDVYSLGVIAYELLSGRLPLDFGTASLAEAARLVAETDPPRLGKIAPSCRDDVEWIVARALEKDPERRYQSAYALHQDIEHFLAGEPTEARPLTTSEGLARWARRHKVAFAGLASTAAAILIGASVAIHFAVKNSQLARLEVAARMEADANAEEARRLAELAGKRADDVQTVSDFVSARMMAIDQRGLGRLIREATVEEVRRGLAEMGFRSEAAESDLTIFRDLLELGNPTTVATSTLDRAFFEPMRAEIDARFAEKPELHLKLLLAFSHLVGSQSRFEAALDSLEAAVVVADSLPGETVETVTARLELGSALAAMSRFSEAEEVLEEAMRRAEGVLEPTDKRLAHALDELAMAANERGDKAAAEELMREQLALLEATEASPFEERREAVFTLNNLSFLLSSMGRADECLELSERAMELVRLGTLGEEDIEIAARGMRAAALSAVWRLEDSLEEWKGAIAISRSYHGDHHSHTSNLYRGFATALMNLERFAEAEAPLRAVLDFNAQELGDGHPATLASRQALAIALFLLGEWEEAVGLAKTLLGQVEERTGPGSPDALIAAGVLLEIYAALSAGEPGAGYQQASAALRLRYPEVEPGLGWTPGRPEAR